MQTVNEATPATPATPAQSAQSPAATPDPLQPVSTPRVDGKSPNPPDEEEQDAPEDTRIQILDLHTLNPIISYRNHIFDCRWTSTIGTDLLITAPNLDSVLPKLAEGKGFDVLAASSIKIVGQSAQLVPKPDARVPRDAASDELVNQEEDEEVVKIPVGIASSKARQNQARFLERLIKIKKAKGEQDAVTVHSQKPMTHSGWRVRQNQRRAGEQAEIENLRRLAAEGDESASKALKELEAQANDSDEEPEGAANIMESGRGGIRGRAKRTYKKRGRKRRALGGLFRDYRPADGDEAGADIRAVPTTTPSSWDAVGPVLADDTATTITEPTKPIVGGDTDMPDVPV